MRKSTELIHTGERVTAGITPSLTTPIYETTTFVFETRRSRRPTTRAARRVPLLALRQPDGRRRRAEARRARRRRGGAASSVGQARHDDGADGAARAGDEVVCSAAIYGGTLHLLADLLPKFGIAAAVRVDRGARDGPSRSSRPRRKLVWFESPINPTLRCVDIARGRRRVPRARRAVGHRQHVREPDQPAAARARRRSRDAQRDEVPERPQRRHRRRARRSAALIEPI